MYLDDWARVHNISTAAMADLYQRIGVSPPEPRPRSDIESEAGVQNDVRLEAAEIGDKLMRNNNGAYDERHPPSPGSRWGLGNDSKRANEKFKSSDLIGIKRLLITPQHVGSHVGQFLAREIKPAKWVYRGTDTEQAQLAFLNYVLMMGGDAAFAIGRGTI